MDSKKVEQILSDALKELEGNVRDVSVVRRESDSDDNLVKAVASNISLGDSLNAAKEILDEGAYEKLRKRKHDIDHSIAGLREIYLASVLKRRKETLDKCKRRYQSYVNSLKEGRLIYEEAIDMVNVRNALWIMQKEFKNVDEIEYPSDEIEELDKQFKAMSKDMLSVLKEANKTLSDIQKLHTKERWWLDFNK